jgi:hypothetical protein
MKRWLWKVFAWLFPGEWLNAPMQPHPLTPSPQAERGNQEQPLMVDAGLVGMKPEIGIMWRKYPSMAEICTALPVDMEDAEWIWNACAFSDRVWALVTINDVARAVKAGVPITEIRLHGLAVMQMSPEWERK